MAAALTAAELVAAYRAGDLSPVEATEDCLARIERRDPELNAFCLVDGERALADARGSEARWARGEPAGPLDGVPVGVKDLLVTRGWPTLRGSKAVDPAGPWEDDAPVVAALRRSGAVLPGKTTTPELGWKGVTDSALEGVTRNPWDPAKTPGGSSGGSSAAIAAGMVPLALGTDGGGSIRIPCGFSGLAGLKPTFGRVPAWPASPFGPVAHVGPMARTVTDTALLLDVMAEPDARDWQALAPPGSSFLKDLRRGVRDKRIAFSPTMGFAENVEPEVAELVAAAARRFSELGARVDEIDPPGGDPGEIFRTLWWGGAGFVFGHVTADKRQLLDPGLAAVAEEGARISTRQYIEANVARGAYASRMRQFMENYDLLLTPSLAVAAFDVGKLSPYADGSWTRWTPFTYPFNLTQQPAASVPCGRTRVGLPVGLQIVGRHYDEWSVLQAAFAYEAADPHVDDIPEGFA